MDGWLSIHSSGVTLLRNHRKVRDWASSPNTSSALFLFVMDIDLHLGFY